MESIKVNSTLLKNVNRKKILTVIDETGRLSRVELKKILGKDGKTVTNITNGLLNDRLITSVGYSSFTGGRRRELLTINPDFGYIIGIHLGIHHIRGVITDFKNNILVMEKLPITPEESKESLIHKIRKTLKFLVESKNIPIEQLLGIGFVANGFFNSKEGIWINSVNNLYWKNIPIVKILKEQYNIPIYLEDSSRSMTIAEKSFGNAKRKDNYIYLDIGAGIGLGVIYKGRLFNGGTHSLAELGHTIVVPNGDVCSCGNKGCLETVASGWAIKKEVKNRIRNGQKSVILEYCNGDTDNIDSDIIFKAFNNNDKLAEEVLNSASNYLGIAVANLINLFTPHTIVFGGHLSNLSSKFITNLKCNIEKFAMPLLFKKVNFLTTGLGDDSAVLGAITLVRDSYFSINEIK